MFVVAEDFVGATAVEDREGAAAFANCPDFVAKSRASNPPLFAPEPLAERVDDRVGQALPGARRQFAREPVGLRMLDAEGHMSRLLSRI